MGEMRRHGNRQQSACANGVVGGDGGVEMECVRDEVR